MPKSHLRILLYLAYTALVLAALWLLLPGLLPFLVALLLACLLERPVQFLSAHTRLRRTWAALVVLLVFTLLLFGGCIVLARRSWYELSLLGSRLPLLNDALLRLQNWIEGLLYRLRIALSPSARAALESALDAALSHLYTGVTELSGRILTRLAGSLSLLPATVLFLFTTLLGAYFMLAGRPALLAWFRKTVPQPWLTKQEQIVKRLKKALGGWLRTQVILMGVTCALLTAGFLLIGVKAALLLAAGVALLDALPVFGTGTVLLPWAAAQALSGDFGRCAALVALYAVIWLARSLLEPKLIADRAGLHPLAALFAMYMGFSLFGVAGMFLAPLAAMVLRQIWDSGLFPTRS